MSQVPIEDVTSTSSSDEFFDILTKDVAHSPIRLFEKEKRDRKPPERYG